MLSHGNAMAENAMTVDETKLQIDQFPAQGESRPRGLSPKAAIPVLLLAALVGIAIYRGIISRTNAEKALQGETRQLAIPTLIVVHPTTGPVADEIVLPGNTQAFTEAPIYARTNGYLKRWYFDIGARVKAGQLLAEIETPEVDQQLQQAKAGLATSQANLELAKSTAARWQFLLKTDSVSKQETDEKLGALSANQALTDAAASNVRRLEELKGFQRIYAPFDGVVTARNVDVGALIDAGAGGQSRELFHLASINRLRVYVNVPEVDLRAATPGATAMLTLDEYPGRQFHGKIVRNSNAIDRAAHTLLVEVDVDNPKGELLPGAYASVHLKLPSQVQRLTIPSNAVLFREEGLRAADVRNGRTQLVPITIGRDFGKTLEVASGLKPDDLVVINPPDSLISGTPVHTKAQTE
jgi:RND family efflux transporter MFP subunit